MNSLSSSLSNGSSSSGGSTNGGHNVLDSSLLTKRLVSNGTPTPYNQLDLGGLSAYEKWSNGSEACSQNGKCSHLYGSYSSFH